MFLISSEEFKGRIEIKTNFSWKLIVKGGFFNLLFYYPIILLIFFCPFFP
ncbi:hypothetical protein BH23BAC1_BH23BAC1_34970 [soil metagenome]